MERRRGARLALALVGCVLAACSSGSGGGQGASGSTPGTAGGATTGRAPTVEFVAGAAEQANGTPPAYDAVSTCGSSTATYLAELADVSPDQAKVMREWADVVPGGKQILASGVVRSVHLGPQDLPMSHPFGDDLSMNVSLDPQFVPFAKQLGKEGEPEEGTEPATPSGQQGTAAGEGGEAGEGAATAEDPAAGEDAAALAAGTTQPSAATTPATSPPTTAAAKVDVREGDFSTEEKPGIMHVEISSGMLPHRQRPASPDGQTWRDLSDHNLTGFQPGFDHPGIGDRVVMMGRWIIDCGHANFGTEMHALSYLAWAHRDGDTTTIHFFQNPYRDTESYSPDASILGKAGDASRLSQPDTKPFPPYFVDEVVRLITGKTDRLRSQELIEAVAASPADWKVCDPDAGRVEVAYDIVTRPGSDVKVTADGGCVTVHSALGSSFSPADATMHTCSLPWTFLDAIASDAVGGDSLNVRRIIKSRVPEQYWPLVDRDPVAACADALAGPDVNPAPGGQDVRPSGDQPFPSYGVITLRRAS